MSILSKVVPSPRFQWSLFFAVALAISSWSGDGGAYGLAGAITGRFLLFYFPMTWVYRYDFIELLSNIRGSEPKKSK